MDLLYVEIGEDLDKTYKGDLFQTIRDWSKTQVSGIIH